MYIARPKWQSRNGKVYESVWLRESYRENGKVKTRNVANLRNCTIEEIDAIELALKHKGNLDVLGPKTKIKLKEGMSVGAVWVVYDVARRLGIEKALGNDRQGKLALWQVIARVIDQGSRLSAVRLAMTHAACDVLGLEKGFDENDLYKNLTWLSEQQPKIEKRLFKARRGEAKPELFLYDVTSSYLEGDQNAFGAYGYNRDKKKGKKQIVIGLLCDESGEPVSVEVFDGNTQDPQTFGAQVHKTAKCFKCERVTFVGDRGMIKSGQIEELNEANFHYITAITKPQIDALINKGVLQMELFDVNVCEVEDGEGDDRLRYILRRNPLRAEQLAATRNDKQAAVEKHIVKKNTYLAEHPRAKVGVAQREVADKIARLKLKGCIEVKAQGRTLRLEVDDDALEEAARLDGCYVIKTDLPQRAADKNTVHDRYKDLAMVEQAFGNCKTRHLEVRPINVRTRANTRGHVFAVMLAYAIRRELSRAWAGFDLTVEEGLDQLKTLCSMEVQFETGAKCLQIPEPREQSLALLDALDIRMPEVLPKSKARVRTHKTLQSERKV